MPPRLVDFGSLNPPQREAVSTLQGPLLVLAGAGSGKTRVITYRIAHLIETGVRPTAICAVSFTNKAADELRERVERLCGSATARGIVLGTFHSLGLLILKAETAALGYETGFTVYDSGDQLSVLRDILREVSVSSRKLDIKSLHSRISRLKNAGVSPEAFLTQLKKARFVNEYDGYAAEVYPRYQARLRALRALDFDDLLVETLRLLERDEAVRTRWQSRFQYLMIDEYQDTNRCQLDLLRVLSAVHRNLAVVGDDDQSIYAWRGAESRNILDFAQHFPGAKVIKLEENYRSTQIILAAANAVIARNPRRHPKQLFTSKQGGDLIEVVACPDDHAEAQFIAEDIERSVAEDNLSLRDVAVLYRSNALVAPIEEALRRARIAYRVVGGQAFFDRKEIKDATAYCKLLVFPHDEIALRRVLNYPPRGLGPNAVERLTQGHRAARTHDPNASLWDVVLALSAARQADLFGQPTTVASEDGPLSPRSVASLGRFCDVVQAHRAAFAKGIPPAQLAAFFDGYLVALGIKDDLIRAGPTRLIAERRLKYLDEFLASIARSAERQGPRFDLHEYLQRISLSSRDADAEDGLRDEVTLSTLHGAKGLEFRLVFLAGFEDGILPHRRSLDPRPIDQTVAGQRLDEDGPSDDGAPPSDVEEERRLCYVGITRARERLVLLHVHERNGRLEVKTPSRFLADIPSHLLRLQDLENPATQKPTKDPEALALQSLSRMLALAGDDQGILK